MKKAINFYSAIILLFITITVENGIAQSDSPLDMLYMITENSAKDASTYANQYFSPIFKGLGYGFNNGWYNTAKTHKPLGFDLTFSVNLAFVPSKDEYFTFNNQDYQVTKLVNGSEAKTPTIFGPDKAGPGLEVRDNQTNILLASMNGINGAGLKDEIGFNAVPSPILQLGVGVIKNTDIKIRYIPDVAGNDVDYSVWGLGIMHDVGQWIPVVKQLPVDISVFGAYSSLKADIFWDPVDDFPGTNQQISSSIKGYTIEALISKKVAVLTFLGGLGYNKAKTDFSFLGTYNFTYPEAPGLGEVSLTDPIGINTKDGSVRATFGLRLQLAIVTLHANYTFNGYNLLNVGLGFSFR